MFSNFPGAHKSRRGYSSVVEHSTADREVPGSNPGAPSRKLFLFLLFIFKKYCNILKF